MIEKIKRSIKDISIKLSFTSCDYTVSQKILMCDSFIKIAEEFPEETVDYFINGSRRHNLQNKVFKKYISILEKSLPLNIVKGGKKQKIESMNDPILNIFVGTQRFEDVIPLSGKLKNNTKDLYIGGRKGSIVKPYYIGKIINVFDSVSGESIIHDVEDYSFTWIKINKKHSNKKVIVEHLAMPPHYQMGPMVYLNRIKSEVKKAL